MRLDLSIRLKIGYGGSFVMSDWADDAIRKLNQKREDKRIADEVFVERQRVKRVHGVPLWDGVKAKILANVLELKERSGGDILVIHVNRPYEISICNIADGNQTLHVTFAPDMGKLSWICGEKSGGWEVNVTADGGAQFRRGLVSTTPDSMSRQMLNAVLGL